MQGNELHDRGLRSPSVFQVFKTTQISLSFVLFLSLSLSFQEPAWRRSALPKCFSSTLITHNFTVLLIFLNIFVLSQLVRNYPSIDQLWSTHTPWTQLPSLDPGGRTHCPCLKLHLNRPFVIRLMLRWTQKCPHYAAIVLDCWVLLKCTCITLSSTLTNDLYVYVINILLSKPVLFFL